MANINTNVIRRCKDSIASIILQSTIIIKLRFRFQCFLFFNSHVDIGEYLTPYIKTNLNIDAITFLHKVMTFLEQVTLISVLISHK